MERAAVRDASVVVDHLISGKAIEGSLIGPGLLIAEVSSAVARLRRHGRLHPDAADHAIRTLLQLPVRSIPDAVLLPLAWRLNQVVSMADAFYVACAMLFDAPLHTNDRRLARAVAGLGVRVVS